MCAPYPNFDSPQKEQTLAWQRRPRKQQTVKAQHGACNLSAQCAVGWKDLEKPQPHLQYKIITSTNSTPPRKRQIRYLLEVPFVLPMQEVEFQCLIASILNLTLRSSSSQCAWCRRQKATPSTRAGSTKKGVPVQNKARNASRKR